MPTTYTSMDDVINEARRRDPRLRDMPGPAVYQEVLRRAPSIKDRIIINGVSVADNEKATAKQSDFKPSGTQEFTRGLGETNPVVQVHEAASAAAEKGRTNPVGAMGDILKQGLEGASDALPVSPVRLGRQVAHGLRGALQFAQGDEGGGLETATQDVPIVGPAVHDIRSGNLPHLAGSTAGNILNALLAKKLMGGGGGDGPPPPGAGGGGGLKAALADGLGAVHRRGVVRGLAGVGEKMLRGDPPPVAEVPAGPAPEPKLIPLRTVDPVTGVKGTTYDVPTRGQFIPAEVPKAAPGRPLRAIQTVDPNGEVGTLFDDPTKGQFYPRGEGGSSPAASQGPSAGAVAKAPKVKGVKAALEAVQEPAKGAGSPPTKDAANSLQRLLQNAVEQPAEADATVGVDGPPTPPEATPPTPGTAMEDMMRKTRERIAPGGSGNAFADLFESLKQGQAAADSAPSPTTPPRRGMSLMEMAMREAQNPDPALAEAPAIPDNAGLPRSILPPDPMDVNNAVSEALKRYLAKHGKLPPGENGPIQ